MSSQQINLVVAAVSFAAASFLLLDVWIYRRRLFRKAAISAGVLTVSGAINAVFALL